MLFLVFAPLYQVEHYIKKLIVAKILPRHHQFVLAFNLDMGYETNIPWIEAI